MDPAICKSDQHGLVQIPRTQLSALGQSKEQSPLSKAFQLQVRLLTLRNLTQKTHNNFYFVTYHPWSSLLSFFPLFCNWGKFQGNYYSQPISQGYCGGGKKRRQGRSISYVHHLELLIRYPWNQLILMGLLPHLFQWKGPTLNPKEFWLVRSRRRVFSAVAPTLWNILLLEMWDPPSHSGLPEKPENLALSLGLGPRQRSAMLKWLMGREDSYPKTVLCVGF